jgi:hypothetical protein
MKKTYFSNRVYKNTLSNRYVEATCQALLVFNQAERFAYHVQLREERTDKKALAQSLQKETKQRYQLDDYYANSAVQQGKAILSSQKELKKLYKQQKDEQIKATKKKIKETKSRLTVLKKIKTSFVKGIPSFNKMSPEQQYGNFFVVHFKKETKIFYHAYSFEHTYLTRRLSF